MATNVTHIFISLSGFSEEGSATRDLQSFVALPRPPISPRTEARRALRLRLSPQAGGGLRQPLPLHKGRPADAAAGARTHKPEKQRGKRFPREFVCRRNLNRILSRPKAHIIRLPLNKVWKASNIFRVRNLWEKFEIGL